MFETTEKQCDDADARSERTLNFSTGEKNVNMAKMILFFLMTFIFFSFNHMLFFTRERSGEDTEFKPIETNFSGF